MLSTYQHPPKYIYIYMYSSANRKRPFLEHVIAVDFDSNICYRIFGMSNGRSMCLPVVADSNVRNNFHQTREIRMRAIAVHLTRMAVLSF